MKFRATIREKGTPIRKAWRETFTEHTDQPKTFVKEIIKKFNSRPGETPREVLAVIILDKEDIGSHIFEKTNAVTIVKRGRNYDTYKCTICGATGKRYGLSEMITLDKRYKNRTCKGIKV